MAKLQLSVEIAAAPDRVAAFFVPQRMLYWYGADMQAEFEVQGGAADFSVGQKVKISWRLAGKSVALTAVVMRYEPGRVLQWEFRDAYGVRGLQRWEIEAAASGARVGMLDEYQMPGSGPVWRFFDRVFTQRAVARRNRSYMQALKKLAERS